MNPYRHDQFLSGMLADSRRYIGPRDELESLLARVSAERPAAISLVGPWGIGKSFMLQYLANPQGARQAFAMVMGEPFRTEPERLCFVLIDSEGLIADDLLANNLALLLYDALLADLAQVFAVPAFDEVPITRLRDLRPRSIAELRERIAAELMQAREELTAAELRADFDRALGAAFPDRLLTLLRYLAGWGMRIVFLLDKFDRLAARLDRTDFDHLRVLLALAAVVLSSRQALSRIVSDTAQSSPFFNLLEKLNLLSLHVLPLGEAQRLIREPPTWFPETHDLAFSESDVDFILELTGTHPDIVRATCEELFTWVRRRSNGSAAGGDLLPPADRPFLRARLRVIFADAFSVLWHRLEADERHLMRAMVQHDVQPDPAQALDPASPLSRLIERGYVVSSQGRYRLFAGLLHDYVRDQAELPAPAAVAPLPLTDLEHKFLAILRERPGTTIDRDEIIRQLYDLDPASGDLRPYYSRLDALLFRLRGKLERDAVLVENVRGQGYRLVYVR